MFENFEVGRTEEDHMHFAIGSFENAYRTIFAACRNEKELKWAYTALKERLEYAYKFGREDLNNHMFVGIVKLTK